MNVPISDGTLLETAIAIERNGIAFYDVMSKSVENVEVRDVFQYLSYIEHQHVGIFENMLYEICERGISQISPEEYGDYIKSLRENALFNEEMITLESGKLLATPFGRRVSELYIDPFSAVIIRDGLYNRPDKLTEVSILQLVSHTPDLSPKLYPRGKESEQLIAYASEHSSELIFKQPDPWNSMYSYEQNLDLQKICFLLKNISQCSHLTLSSFLFDFLRTIDSFSFIGFLILHDNSKHYLINTIK